MMRRAPKAKAHRRTFAYARRRGEQIEEAKALLAELEALRAFRESHVVVCPCPLCAAARAEDGFPVEPGRVDGRWPKSGRHG